MQLPYVIREMGHRAFGRIPVRVRSGINRGRKWSAVALGRGYGTGSFGADRLAALAVVTRKGDSFWDIGAHKGFVALAASKMVGPSGRVVAVEPSATNLRFLNRHVEWNGCDNVTVVPVALSDAPGEAAFGGRGSSIAFHLGEGPEAVPVRTLEALAAQQGLPAPSVLKLDVEGEEAAVLRGMGPLLDGGQALLISTHGRGLYEECRRLLVGCGFRVYDSWEIRRRMESGAPWSSDHDLLAIGPDRPSDEQSLRELRLIAGPRGG
jgi:FkbM family methyltransferase